MVMRGVVGASTANGHFEVHAHAHQKLANVSWEAWIELQLQWSDMAQHVRLECA